MVLWDNFAGASFLWSPVLLSLLHRIVMGMFYDEYNMGYF